MNLLHPALTVLMITVQVRSASVKSADCQLMADLVFIVDSSTSLHPREFEQLKQFVDEVVQGLLISLDNVRVALIRFSTQADVISTLDQSTSNEAIRKTINNMAYKEGGTNTARGLQMARTHVLLPERGDRSDVADVVVVLTDGRSWYPDKTVAQAKMLREQGAEVVALGVGGGVKAEELEAMAPGQVHTINSVAQLEDAIDDVRASVCFVANEANAKLHLNHSSTAETTTTSTTTTTDTTTTLTTKTSAPTEESTSPPLTPTPTNTTEVETQSVSSSSSSSSSSTSKPSPSTTSTQLPSPESSPPPNASTFDPDAKWGNGKTRPSTLSASEESTESVPSSSASEEDTPTKLLPPASEELNITQPLTPASEEEKDSVKPFLSASNSDDIQCQAVKAKKENR